jgi:hypothetical protein
MPPVTTPWLFLLNRRNLSCAHRRGWETKFLLVQTHGGCGGARVVSTPSVPPECAGGEVQRPCQSGRCGLGQTALGRSADFQVGFRRSPRQMRDLFSSDAVSRLGNRRSGSEASALARRPTLCEYMCVTHPQPPFHGRLGDEQIFVSHPRPAAGENYAIESAG